MNEKIATAAGNYIAAELEYMRDECESDTPVGELIGIALWTVYETIHGFNVELNRRYWTLSNYAPALTAFNELVKAVTA